MLWCKLCAGVGMKKVIMTRVTSLEDLIIRGKEKLNLVDDISRLGVFLEDGTQICAEEDFIEEIIGGQVLVLRAGERKEGVDEEGETMQVEAEGKKIEEQHQESSNMLTPARKKLKLDGDKREENSPSSKSDSSSGSSCIEPLELPPFTPFVKCSLRDGDCNPTVWNLMMEQMQQFYIEHYPDRLKGAADYKLIGEMMFRRYPAIKRDGKRPWSHLTHLLSGRLRTYRHNIKFKFGAQKSPESSKKEGVDSLETMPENSSSDSASSTGSVHPWQSLMMSEKEDDVKLKKLLPEKDYIMLMKELQKEFAKNSPSKTHMKSILKKTFPNRRAEIEKLDREGSPMMSSVILDWPCFQYGYYIMEEMKMILCKSDKDMEKVYARARKAMKAVQGLVPKDVLKNKEGDVSTLGMVEYVGCMVGYKKCKGKADIPISKHFDATEEQIDSLTTTLPNSPPWLFCFFDKNDRFEMAQVGGDRQQVDLQANDIMFAIMTYISCYFVFHVGFSKEWSNFLGFFQQTLFNLPYTEGVRTKNFIESISKFNKCLDGVIEKSNFKKTCV